VSTIELTGDDDAMIWQFHSSGVYSSLYVVINFRGVKPVYLPIVWKLVALPIHFFLWLLFKNKLLTRGNLEKRKNIDDPTCLFCSDKESIHYLFV
jgi:hypothetical protein